MPVGAVARMLNDIFSPNCMPQFQRFGAYPVVLPSWDACPDVAGVNCLGLPESR